MTVAAQERPTGRQKQNAQSLHSIPAIRKLTSIVKVTVGATVGTAEGRRDGDEDGRSAGFVAGRAEGRRDGSLEGSEGGRTKGCGEGRSAGSADGSEDGHHDGSAEGRFGLEWGNEGLGVGAPVGGQTVAPPPHAQHIDVLEKSLSS